MDFKELQDRHPRAQREDWHRHDNGGGWVENSASVEASVYVGPDAIVCEEARVSDQVRICDEAHVCGNSRISGNAVIRRHALLRQWCHIYGREGVEVSGGALIGACAVITKGRWEAAPLYILGSLHAVQISCPGYIRIGCLQHPIKYWLKNYKKIGSVYCYPKSSVQEYGEYIKLIAKLHKMGVPKVVGYN